MKPISAICTSVYSLNHLSEKSRHYVYFQVTFPGNNQGSLTIETDQHHQDPVASKLEVFGNIMNTEYQPWAKDSWQDALLNAWLRYTKVTGYCAATTRDMVFELQEQEDNSYCYELNNTSKKQTRSMYPRGTIINKDGTESLIMLLPQENPDLFFQSESSEEANSAQEHPSNTPINKANKTESSNAPFSGTDFQIISGFMIAAGAAAVAVAFIVLNAASCSIAGLVVAGLGVASVLTGIGLFKTGNDHSYKEQEQELLSENALAY